jgi:hypothetical protein
MKTLAPFLLLLAACRASSPPLGEPATVTFYGDVPRLETWRAYVVEDAHVHSTSPSSACFTEILDRIRRQIPGAEKFPDLDDGFCVRLMGAAHGGPGRLVLLLVPSADEPAEALAVEVPLLAPGETERTFAAPDLAIDLERPAGKKGASIERGRVTVRRVAAARYDVEIFAVLKPGPVQVVARAQAGAVP